MERIQAMAQAKYEKGTWKKKQTFNSCTWAKSPSYSADCKQQHGIHNSVVDIAS